MKRILLTGYRGFMGKHLRERLLSRSDYYLALIDKKGGKNGDIRNEKAIKKLFQTFKPEIVIHLAARTGVRNGEKEPEDYISTNIYGTHNLLKLSQEYGVKKFLNASSSSVYGNQKCPLKETMKCDNQLSLYALTKKSGEDLCRMFKELPVTVFRPFTVYGESGRKDMVVRKLIEAGKYGKTFYRYGDGESVRGYTNVHDLVDGIVKLIDYKPKSNFDIFNLGGVEQIKLNELIDTVKKRFPNLKVEEAERHPADIDQSYADISKARNKLGWEPKGNFKKEIEKLCSEL